MDTPERVSESNRSLDIVAVYSGDISLRYLTGKGRPATDKAAR